MYKSFVKHCSFIENEYLYKFVMTSMYLNEAQREREIMELWRNGENNVSIAKAVGYDEKTIRNRKKVLVEKYNNLLESNKIFIVLIRVFPNLSEQFPEFPVFVRLMSFQLI